MHDFTPAQEAIDAIPQQTFGGSQPEFLFRLSLEVQADGEVVGIGTNVGRSTIALGYAQKCMGGPPINTIDIYQHPDIVKNLESAGVSEHVNRIVSPSHLKAKTWDKPIRLLWIDGDHSFRGAYRDIKSWLPHLAKGGVIALHDYPGHKGSMAIYRAVTKKLLGNPYEYRLRADREAGSIIVFEKISEGEQQVRNLKASLYWFLRDLRSIFIELFPRVASRIIDRIKGEK